MTDNIQGKQIKVGNLGIHYFTAGHGEPLVVIHGAGGGAEGWLQSGAELCEHHRIYVPDLPGFGDSQPMSGNYGVAEFVQFVEDFTHSLGLTRFHLVGHSAGGGIALCYAFKFPYKIGKLVLVSSMCLGKEMTLWIRVLSGSVTLRSLGMAAATIMEVTKRLVSSVYAPFKFVNPLPQGKIRLGANMTTLKEQTMVLMNQLSELTVPTLLVWGADDSVVPVSHAYAAARIIPDCQLQVFEGCGHSVYKQKAAEFSRLLSGFLS